MLNNGRVSFVGPPNATGGSEILKYEVNYSMKVGDSLHPGYSGSASECTIFNLSPGSAYTVGVRAANTVGVSGTRCA